MTLNFLKSKLPKCTFNNFLVLKSIFLILTVITIKTLNAKLDSLKFIKSYKIHLAAARMTHLTISNYRIFSY